MPRVELRLRELLHALVVGGDLKQAVEGLAEEVELAGSLARRAISFCTSIDFAG